MFYSARSFLPNIIIDPENPATARASAYISSALRALMYTNARCSPRASPKPTKGAAFGNRQRKASFGILLVLPAHKILRIFWRKTNCVSCVLLVGASRPSPRLPAVGQESC